MKVSDKNMIPEISKHLPRPSQDNTKPIEGQQHVDDPKVQASNQLEQDVIVDFSPELQTVQNIREIIASQPDIREDMVARLKTKIESGKYRMDYKAIADKLVESHLKENL